MTGSRGAANRECAAWQGANSVSTDCGDGEGQLGAGKYQDAQIARADATAKTAIPRTEPREGMAISCCPLSLQLWPVTTGSPPGSSALALGAGGTFENSTNVEQPVTAQTK